MTDITGLLASMTLEEKCAQLTSAWYSQISTDRRPDPDKMAGLLRHGIGHVTRISVETADGPGLTSSYANDVQRFLKEQTRLGIPAIVHEEAAGGLCARGATQFPQGIGLASSWDPEMIEEVASVIGRQMRAVGANLALSPVVDIARDPRWGRLEETYGEDPELSSRIAVAFVRGLQAQGVAATLKHFVAYGVPNGGLNWGAASPGPRLLRDVLAAPFRAAINEAGVMAVMPSYNEVDGLPSHGSPELLGQLLREEMGFAGTTVADYFGVPCLQSYHHVAADAAGAAYLAIMAGLDVELPSGECYAHLPALVESGAVPAERIDGACRRVLEQKVRLGLFDEPLVDVGRAEEAFDRDEDRLLARRVAVQSIVLLTNDGTLPLRPGQRVALLGPSLDDPRLMLGDYHFPAHLEIMLQNNALAPTSDGSPIAAPPQIRTPTLGAVLAERVQVAADVARADVAVVCVGGRSGLTESDTSGEFRDAADLRLPAAQLALIEETAATGVPVVVVIIDGRARSLTEVLPHAGAVVMAWLPGEEGGTALADVLQGEADPGGRLPVSLLRRAGQVGVHSGMHHGDGRSMIYGDYVDGPAAPLFAFGHGLSYTRWDYTDLQVTVGDTTEEVAVSVTVTNAGNRAGGEVVQVYFSDEVASVGLPAWRLLAFRRIEAGAGESTPLRFTVPAGRLGFTGADLRYRVEPGHFAFRVAGLTAKGEVKGDVAFPDRNNLAPFSAAVS